ncbi:MAG: transcription antitermination factor NusB [Christensenellales bacterium]
MSRRTARETAMQLAFEWSISGGNEESIKELFEDIPYRDDDMEYINGVLEGIKGNQKQIDDLIAGSAIGWSIQRMAKVDLAILRLAIYEILYRDEIPQSVSVNEAVELAKQYGGDKSASFINGILGKLLRDQAVVKE